MFGIVENAPLVIAVKKHDTLGLYLWWIGLPTSLDLR